MNIKVYIQSLMEKVKKGNLKLKLLGLVGVSVAGLSLSGCNSEEKSNMSNNSTSMQSVDAEESDISNDSTSMQSVDAEESDIFTEQENEEVVSDFMPFVREDGKIAQLLATSIGDSYAVKFGYFEVDKESSTLYLVDAFTETKINLGYISSYSSDIKFYVTEAANLFEIEQVLSGGITYKESVDLISGIANFIPDSNKGYLKYYKISDEQQENCLQRTMDNFDLTTLDYEAFASESTYVK